MMPQALPCAEAAAAKAVPQKLHARHGERCANFENCGNTLTTGRIHGKGMYCDAYACGPRGVAGGITKQRKAEKAARKAEKAARPEKRLSDENAPPQSQPLPRQQRAAVLAERPSRFLGPTRHTCAPQVSWISGFFASDTSNRRFVHSPQLPVCALMPGA